MKCTWITDKRQTCGKETNKPCPSVWIKHQQFNPIVLHCFFSGIDGEQYLDLLDAFVCEEHMPKYQAYLRRSNIAKRAIKTRNINKENWDYEI